MASKRRASHSQELGTVPLDQRITLSWSDVRVTFDPKPGLMDKLCKRPQPSPKVILKGVSGVAAPGRLVALMGASGAGKTTLLNVLTDRGVSGLTVSGNVLLNGHPMSELQGQGSDLIGYVQQNDILPPTLTVREYLVFSGILTMYGRLTEEQVSEKADELLGQLFGDRRLLLLDEPTTGLDSYVAQLLVENLRSLAALGCNIICTIHQPSSQVFNLFDDLFLMAEGRCVYFGDRQNGVPYFSRLGYVCPDTFSPSDYLIDMLAIKPEMEEECLDRVEKIASAYEESSLAKGIRDKLRDEYLKVTETELIEAMHLDGRLNTSRHAPWIKEFMFLFWRCVISMWRYPILILLRVLLIACASVLLMVIYWQPKGIYTVSRTSAVQGLLFFISSFFIIFNSLLILSILPSDLPLVIREHRDGLYRLGAYYLTTFIFQSIVGAIIMVMSVCAVYFAVGLKRETGAFFIALGILVVMYLINVGFAALVSSICETAGDTVSNAIPLVFLSNVLGGYFCRLSDIPRYLAPLMFINWLPWGYEMLSINQWSGNVTFVCEPERSCYESGDDVMKVFGLDRNAFHRDLALVLGQLAGYHIVAFVILSLKMRFKWSG